MITTKITEIFNIKHPIMQGGMNHLAVPEFAAAVSNAGGLGTFNALLYSSADDFREAVQMAKRLTDQPFCVNISMSPKPKAGELTPDYFGIVAEEKVPVVETSGRSPQEFMPMLKEAKTKVIHKVATVKHAQKVESIGVDAISIIGIESAGHPGMDDVGTIVLGRKAAKELNVPVIIGGGIVDGAGLAAALSLGGEGVVMGTRFVATHECIIHPNFKDWIVSANEADTVLILRSVKNMMRTRKNQSALTCLKLEEKGAEFPEIFKVINGTVSRKSQYEGNLEEGILAIGQAIGLINEIKTVQEVIDDMVAEAENIIKALHRDVLYVT